MADAPAPAPETAQTKRSFLTRTFDVRVSAFLSGLIWLLGLTVSFISIVLIRDKHPELGLGVTEGWSLAGFSVLFLGLIYLDVHQMEKETGTGKREYQDFEGTFIEVLLRFAIVCCLLWAVGELQVWAEMRKYYTNFCQHLGICQASVAPLPSPLPSDSALTFDQVQHFILGTFGTFLSILLWNLVGLLYRLRKTKTKYHEIKTASNKIDNASYILVTSRMAAYVLMAAITALYWLLTLCGVQGKSVEHFVIFVCLFHALIALAVLLLRFEKSHLRCARMLAGALGN